MLKELKWNSIIAAAVFIIGGILLVMFPEASKDITCYALGIGMCIFGIVKLTTYFTMDIRGSIASNDFIAGLLAIIGGLVVIVRHDQMIMMISTLLGLVVIFNGLIKIQRAIVAYRIHYDKAPIYTVLGVMSIILGFVIMFFINGEDLIKALYITTGAGLIYCGISDLYVVFFLTNRFEKFCETYKISGGGAE